MSIVDSASWWGILNYRYNDIVAILHRFLPMGDFAHAVPGDSATPVKVDSLGNPINGTRDFNEAVQKKDAPRVLAYLNGAWWHAPDKQWIHTIPSWSALCDLCSENWVFDEEEEE